MKELGMLWSNIDPTEKRFYEKLSFEGKNLWFSDKQWFDREQEEFERNGGCKSLLQKSDKKPKKCLSGYMIFVWEMRPQIVKENPQMKVLHVMKEVGKRW